MREGEVVSCPHVSPEGTGNTWATSASSSNSTLRQDPEERNMKIIVHFYVLNACQPLKNYSILLNYLTLFTYFMGTADGGTVVKVLCYKSEGRWFNCRWCHGNFSLT
jgi:hypothetical protein